MPAHDRTIDVISFGEALVDFLPNTTGPLRDVATFTKVVGGAPANLAVGLARLERRVALHGKVGLDEFGMFLREAMIREGVETRGLGQTNEAKTGVTFVSLEDNGDRSFLFFREPSADMTVDEGDIDVDLISQSRVFHLGSNLLPAAKPRRATMYALEEASRQNCIVSYDPNIRLHLWPHPDEARRHSTEVLDYAHLVKINEEELEFYADGGTLEEAWENIFRPRGVLALVLTRGARGAEVITASTRATAEAPDAKIVDTTGAGDGFVAGLWCAIFERALDDDPSIDARNFEAFLNTWSTENWESLLSFASEAGTHVCTALGATPGLPTRDALSR
ncbi:MAG: carbohydrate kinase family protein [Myxococcota bacterium]